MSILSQSLGAFFVRVVFAVAAVGSGTSLLGQSADQPSAAASSDPEKRAQWLRAHLPPKVASTPRVSVAETPAETPAPRPKIGFRSGANIGTRTLESPPAESRSAEKRPAVESKSRLAEKPSAKATPAPVAKLTTPAPAEPKIHIAEKSSVKAVPAPIAKQTTPIPEAKTRIVEKSPAKATPAPIAKQTTPVPEPKTRIAEKSAPRSTPSPKLAMAPAITAIPATKTLPTQPAKSRAAEPVAEFTTNHVAGRYPWKSGIITTVFWVGEPVSGNNFTPNYASSWDASWSRTYGGFDNPDPAARRNYIPVKFIPQQNPFYCALPYNDVTRGTTKPEARRCIPWFREAFQREGQSVCRNRWVAIRSRAGKVAYAQWSDCGPFRTDHWQYVFGTERPKPNLNGGAGLDVSPAVRDFLGLSSTDQTDWKFVEAKDVPSGPWGLYGDNNTFAGKNSRAKTTTHSGARTADNFGPLRVREL